MKSSVVSSDLASSDLASSHTAHELTRVKPDLLVATPPTPLNQGLPNAWVAVVVSVGLVVLPLLLKEMGADYYISLCARMLIMALAASALNLVLGYTGMVSLGHAAYLGLGAYTVAVLAQQGITQMWVVTPLAVVVSGLAACMMGWVSLRTQGVYFIMITLAFAQLFYYLTISLPVLGGEDGLQLMQRSRTPGLNLDNDLSYYYVVLAVAGLAFVLLYRLVASRFGRALVAIRENERRMGAIGYPVFALKLTAFVLSGCLAGLAGTLLVNLNLSVTPYTLAWHQSGILMVMVILGGAGYFWGGLSGAMVYMLLEETISSHTQHWHLFLGLLLLLIVMLAPQGIMSLYGPVQRSKNRLLQRWRKGLHQETGELEQSHPGRRR